MSWSFSALTHYETCPHRRRLMLEGHKDAGTEASQRGNDLHDQIETYFKTPLLNPVEGLPFAEEFSGLKAQTFKVEELWGLDDQWTPIDWRDAWCRMKLDLCIPGGEETVVFDWKSGKPHKLKHTQQGSLYLIGAAAYHPAESYRYEFWYIDSGETLKSKATTPAQVDALKKSWERRVEKMFGDRVLMPKPNKWSCKYCGYREACKYRGDE